VPALDTTRLIAAPGDTFAFFRVDAKLHFRKGTTRAAAAEFLRTHCMRVLGVTSSGAVFVRLPDPGTDWGVWQATFDALRREHLVDIVVQLARSGYPSSDA
jgi:hypothetical protein